MAKVVVIGAGFGGLSAACHLAKAGFKVTVVEKNSTPGGRAMVKRTQGFTFDLGPSWYMMPDVFEEFFADFGKRPKDFFDLKRLDPSYKIFNEKSTYEVPSVPEIYALFERIEPGSSAALKELLKKTKKEYEQIRAEILDRPQLSVLENINRSTLSLIKDPELLGSYHSRIKKYVKDPDLQKILEFMVVFMGGSPSNIPALYTLLTYVDMGQGIFYPMGGMGKLVEAYYKIARSLGVEIKLNHDVTRILSEKGVIRGVETEAGIIDADIVVNNGDYAYVETNLIDERYQTYPESYWKKRTLSPSGLLGYIGVKKKLPNLQHHNLFFDSDWDKHFDEVFSSRKWSKDPMFYLCAPSKTDPSVAPRGMENLFILAPVANGNQPDQKVLERAIDDIIIRIEQKIGTSFANDIVVRDVRAHNYFKSTFHATRGNAFGLAHTLRQSAHLRPKMKSPSIEGLYHVGQFTSPGTGVPIVTLSGKVVSNLIRNQWQKK
jgi:phytoene desaturase